VEKNSAWLDLGGVVVTEKSPVDEGMVPAVRGKVSIDPFISHECFTRQCQVCEKCKSKGLNPCEIVWSMKNKRKTIRCKRCIGKKLKCSLDGADFGIDIWLKINASEDSTLRRKLENERKKEYGKRSGRGVGSKESPPPISSSSDPGVTTTTTMTGCDAKPEERSREPATHSPFEPPTLANIVVSDDRVYFPLARLNHLRAALTNPLRSYDSLSSATKQEAMVHEESKLQALSALIYGRRKILDDLVEQMEQELCQMDGGEEQDPFSLSPLSVD
jgi:hypothetical protein